MRNRARFRFVLAAGLAGAAVVAAASCGFDGEATRELPRDDRDAGPGPSLPEAAPADAPSEADALLDGGPDGAPKACPASDAGATVLARQADGTAFCIDATEVTNAQYDAFLAADAGFGSAPPPLSCAGYVGPFTRKQPAGPPSHPVDHVTWCDGFAYCRWAGKRLCGKIEPGDAGTGEWYAACSAAGTRVYPYGDTYSPTACNTEGSGTLPVASSASCEGGVPGLLDMSGNAGEWVDACDLAARCAFAGGFYGSTVDSTCRSLVGENPAMTQTYAGVGIRCCADAP